MTAVFSRCGAHHGARSPTTSVNVSWLCTSQRWPSSSTRSTRPWCASSATISLSRPPATGLNGSCCSRGMITSFTTAATSSSRTLRMPIAASVAPSRTTRAALAGCVSHSPIRFDTVALASRSRITCSCRKFSAMNCSRPRPRSSLRFGISAVCGIGSPSGCLNSAVTANQSAIAPTIDASAPALTKPSTPPWPCVATYTTAANTSSDSATVRIRRSRTRRSSSASGLGVSRETVTR